MTKLLNMLVIDRKIYSNTKAACMPGMYSEDICTHMLKAILCIVAQISSSCILTCSTMFMYYRFTGFTYMPGSNQFFAEKSLGIRCPSCFLCFPTRVVATDIEETLWNRVTANKSKHEYADIIGNSQTLSEPMGFSIYRYINYINR